MSDILDALVFTSIKNNIPFSDTKRFNELKKAASITASDSDTVNTTVNNYLNSTTIKRACCMAKQNPDLIKGENIEDIQVKIPYIGVPNPRDSLGSKFGFKNISVKVPISLCKSISNSDNGNFNPGDKILDDCDNFIASYCYNMKYLYLLENNNSYDPDEFQGYSPECPCYADLQPWAVDQSGKVSSTGITRSCILTNCDKNTKSTYLDPSSRGGCQGAFTFCTAYTNYGKMNASQGGDINLDQKISQNCSANTGGGGTTSGNNLQQPAQQQPATQQPATQQPAQQQPAQQQPAKVEGEGETSSTKLLIGGGISLLLCCCIIIAIIIVMTRKK